MIKVDSKGNKLADAPAKSYFRMLNAGMPTGGIDAFSRTLEQQEYLYNRYKYHGGPIAAPPNPRAPHVRGVAMDAQTTRNGRYMPSPAHVWLSKGASGGNKPAKGEYAQAHDFGWYRTVPSERWHWQYDGSKDKAKALKNGTKAKYATRIVQAKVGVSVDGVFGDKTEAAVIAYQKSRGLTADGVVGSQTWEAFAGGGSVAPPPEPTPPAPRDEKIYLKVDGEFGPQTIKRLQQYIGTTIDGKLGPNTWRRVGMWLKLPGSFNPDSRSNTLKLQATIGMPASISDGVWLRPKSRQWGKTTTTYLQRYLNAN